MKRTKVLLIASMAVILLLAASCSSDATAEAEVEGSSNVVVVQAAEDGLGSTNLIFGSFQLEDTDMAITAEQAAELAPLWKVYQSMLDSSTAAEAEREALLSQIANVFTTEQQEYITSVETDPTAIQELMSELGIESEMMGGRNMGGDGEERDEAQMEEMQAMRETMGGGEGGGPGGDEGMMSGGEVDEDQMAAMQAERAAEGGGVSGGGQMDTSLLPSLIELLEAKL